MSEENSEIINVYNIKTINYDGTHYATGYAPLIGRVAQCGLTERDAIKNLHEYVHSMPSGCV